MLLKVVGEAAPGRDDILTPKMLLQSHAIFIINWLTFSFFLADALLKIMSHGFLMTPNAYLTV